MVFPEIFRETFPLQKWQWYSPVCYQINALFSEPYLNHWGCNQLIINQYYGMHREVIFLSSGSTNTHVKSLLRWSSTSSTGVSMPPWSHRKNTTSHSGPAPSEWTPGAGSWANAMSAWSPSTPTPQATANSGWTPAAGPLFRMAWFIQKISYLKGNPEGTTLTLSIPMDWSQSLIDFTTNS